MLSVPAAAPLSRRFRVERTTEQHMTIPKRYGSSLLGDAGADLSGTSAVPGVQQEAVAGPFALVALSSRFPAIADLLRLAVSPEYADARWRPQPPPGSRGSASTGRFRFSRP